MTAQSRNRTVALAIVVAAFAVVVLFVWVPLDIQSGVIERVRRRSAVGDSLAPIIAGSVILLGAVLLFVERKRESTTGLTRDSLLFLAVLILTGALSFALMRWTGPVASAVFGLDYRPLRVTAPWKYIGFVSGGWTMVFGLISLLERRFSVRAAVVAALMVGLLIAVYDLPFDDLLLPPNGDV